MLCGDCGSDGPGEGSSETRLLWLRARKKAAGEGRASTSWASSTGDFFSVGKLSSLDLGMMEEAARRRRRMKRVAAPRRRARKAKAPTAMPAMGPVPRVPLCDLGTTEYWRAKSWVRMTLTAGLLVAPGGTRGRMGVVTQGVAPPISEE